MAILKLDSGKGIPGILFQNNQSSGAFVLKAPDGNYGNITVTLPRSSSVITGDASISPTTLSIENTFRNNSGRGFSGILLQNSSGSSVLLVPPNMDNSDIFIDLPGESLPIGNGAGVTPTYDSTKVLKQNNGQGFSGVLLQNKNGSSVTLVPAEGNYGNIVVALPSASSTASTFPPDTNLTFWKNFALSQATANADYAVGAVTATVTAARSASAPATYYNSSGAIQTLTTANVPRFTAGFYDSTGFHSRPGLWVEDSHANKILRSNEFANASWTKVNMTASDAESDGILAATVSSLTATDANATLTQSVVDASAGINTVSIFIKRKTGTGTINLRGHSGESYTDITASVGSTWTRVQVQTASVTNPTYDLQIVTSGDAVYVYGAQLEEFPYMTSYVPTTTAARTRAAETIAYETAGNRTASSETQYIKFTPLGKAFANDSVQRTLTNTSTKNRQMYKSTASALGRIAPNLTDSASVIALTSTTPQPGTSYVFAGGVNHTLPLPYAAMSLDGTREGVYTAADWTDPVWGTTFTIGSTAGGASQANGIFEAAAFYSVYHDVPDVNHVSHAINNAIADHDYILTLDTATSANVVSGSTTGNVLDNDTYDFNGKLIKTGADTVLKFDAVGSDEDFNLGLRLQIKVRAYTISTNSWGSDAVCYDITGQPYVLGSRCYRIVGSQIWMYLVKYNFPLDNNGILVLSKSTDLTGTSWGAETTIYTFTGSVGQAVKYIETSDPGISYLLIARDSPPRKVHLLKTTDNGNTFTLGPVIYAQGSHYAGEGDCVSLSGNRMLAIFRDSSQNYLIMMKSNDEGLTWSTPQDVVLGDNTDEKTTPKLINSAGNPDRVTLFFYDRGDARTKISSGNPEDDAFSNTWRPIYPLGTNSQGNGAICVIDDTQFKYLAYVAKVTGDVPPQTDTLWWVWKDIYNWVEQ